MIVFFILSRYDKGAGFGCGWWMITFPPLSNLTSSVASANEWSADGTLAY